MYKEDGELFWEASLDSFGRLKLNKGESGSCPFRYQGQYEDVETGLYYNRFRYYSPEEGLYISQDPIGLAGGDRFYGYVDDLNSFIDPYGLNSASNLPKLKGSSVSKVEKILQNAGFTQTRVTSTGNQTWNHSDGSEVRIHPYGNQSTTNRSGDLTPKSGLNAHIHKQDTMGNQLNDHGTIRTDPNETHIGIKNPDDYPNVRNRPHG